MFKIVLLDNYFSDSFTQVQIWYWKTFKFHLRLFIRKISKLQELLIKTRKINLKQIFADNHGQNILRFFDDFPNFPFTTSETKRDYNKHGMYELPNELPKSYRSIWKLRNFRIISKLYRIMAQHPVPPPKWKLPPRNPRKIEIKSLLQCAISHENQSLSKMPCPWLWKHRYSPRYKIF